MSEDCYNVLNAHTFYREQEVKNYFYFNLFSHLKIENGYHFCLYIFKAIKELGFSFKNMKKP